MYIKLKLTNVTPRHVDSINKDLFEAVATDTQGKVYDKVTLWKSDWPAITEGSEIMAEIKDTTKNPKFPSTTLYPEKTTGFASGGARSVNMNKLMDKKAENIEKAQDRKNDSIAYFNAINSAIALVKEFKLVDAVDIKESISYWREWFLSEWHKYEADPTKGKSPF
jgi:hypothetical protein